MGHRTDWCADGVGKTRTGARTGEKRPNYDDLVTSPPAAPRTALVFEGGGMRAAYTSGVVVALLEAGIEFGWVGGISAGASNACNYVSRDPDRARRSFVEFAADPRFGDWRTFVRGRGLFHAEYIYEQTSAPGQALPFDWDAFTAHPAAVRIQGFHCASGQVVTWGREDFGTLRDLMVRVRASSTMPGFMPVVTIDGEQYVDGALGPTGGFAWDAARADGFDRFVVVASQPRGYRKPLTRNPAFYRGAFRRLPRVAQALIDRPARYNASLEQLAAWQREGRAYVFHPQTMPVSNRERSVPRLARAHHLGLDQARHELPAIRAFLAG